MHKVLVSTNCQTAPLTAALQRMSAGLVVAGVPATGEPAEKLRVALTAHADAQHWLVAPGNTVARELFAAAARPGARLVTVPQIHFGAFQPDIAYAWHRGTRQLTDPHYNSAIVAWSYAQGLDTAATAALFRPEVFADLGYYAAWDRGVDGLRDAFAASDLAPHFAEFFLHVKRQGCFMYSMNHPKLPAVVQLARLAARAAGLPLARDLAPGEMEDPLNGTVWPVYPALAEPLGLEGSYSWKYIGRKQYIDGLEAFVEQCFARYAEQGIGRADLEITYQKTDALDAALRRHTGR